MTPSDFDIQGPRLFKLKSFADARGFFSERFREDRFAEAGLNAKFVQENFSKSKPGVLRGLHFQYSPAQGKLITCLSGKVWDVAVDIRRASPTFGKHISVVLDSDEPCWLWLPPGFAHGFCVISSEPAGVLYKTDSYYAPSGEAGICWNDKDLNIPWPLAKPILSDRDSVLMSFKEYQSQPRF